MSTEIINIKDYKEKDYIYCGRGSIFGNPFEIGRDGTRDEVCDKFEIHFNHLIKDERFHEEVLKLRGHKLGCYCLPERCHVQIIKDYLNKVVLPEPKKKIAIIGSRDFKDIEKVRSFIKKNRIKIKMIVSGGADGADTLGVQVATEYGIPYKVYPALWKDPDTGVKDRGAGFKRNWDIVRASDLIVAFWDGQSKGTKNSLEICEKLNKPVKIFYFNDNKTQS